jgi:hypothetical protein
VVKQGTIGACYFESLLFGIGYKVGVGLPMVGSWSYCE